MWLHGAPILKVSTFKLWINCLNVVLILMQELKVLVVLSDLSFHSLLNSGTPLHAAAKERKKEAFKFLIENGAFLPDDINESRFNLQLHYCPGLEEEMKHLQRESLLAGEASYSSES